MGVSGVALHTRAPMNPFLEFLHPSAKLKYLCVAWVCHGRLGIPQTGETTGERNSETEEGNSRERETPI